MMLKFLFFIAAYAFVAKGTSVEVEVEELLEMIPYDQVLRIGMEYAMSDPQVKALVGYISSAQFKENMAQLQRSPQFSNLATVASAYNIDAYSLANKFNAALDMQPVSYTVGSSRERMKRSPGDGITGLVREALEITPLDEMKAVYKYKVATNPTFKSLMEKLLDGEANQYLKPIVNSKPLQDTKKDLEEMGIALEEIEDLVEFKLTEFFDINSSKRKTTLPSP